MLRAVAESRAKSLADELVDLYGTLLPQGRQAVLDLLLEQPNSTNALLDAIEAKGIAASALSLENMAALRAHPIDEIRQRATELIAEQGASPNPDRQLVLEELMPITQTEGNALHGKELFVKNCSVCHLHSGIGETIAPELTGMFVHPKSDILTNIIDPSRDVERNFRSYSVIANGRVNVGMYAGESRTTVTMVDSTGKRTVVQRDEIDEVYSSEKSLMPDGFEKTLSQTDLTDLLEFLATPQQFVPLRLDTVATTSSVFGGRGFGNRGGRGGRDGGNARSRRASRDDDDDDNRGRQRRGGWGGFRGLFALEDWKPRTVHGVPFTLINPRQGSVNNLVFLAGSESRFGREMPDSVRLECGLQPKAIHLLSGVSFGGYPDYDEETTSMTVRLHYEDGQTEDHELVNGVHFANYRQREDVPKSQYALSAGDQQMRYLAIEPARDVTIKEIEFAKGDNPTGPMVLAVTAELP
jgi:hypothetical protein